MKIKICECQEYLFSGFLSKKLKLFNKKLGLKDFKEPVSALSSLIMAIYLIYVYRFSNKIIDLPQNIMSKIIYSFFISNLFSSYMIHSYGNVGSNIMYLFS